MVKVYEVDQGSPEWHQARAGCVTASMFKTARSKVGLLTDQQTKYVEAIRKGLTEKEAQAFAGYKAAPRSSGIERALAGEKIGEWSEGAKDYAFQLAIERISGQPLDEGFETYAMRRGHELEPMARMEHEMQTGLIVRHAGFVSTDDGKFGGSADGLIDDDGGSEYKCLISPQTLRAVIIEHDISAYIDQVQGCLWLTGRDWWDFCMYCPALTPTGKQLYRRRFYRDEAYIEALEADLIEFEREVTRIEQRLRAPDPVDAAVTAIADPLGV